MLGEHARVAAAVFVLALVSHGEPTRRRLLVLASTFVCPSLYLCFQARE